MIASVLRALVLASSALFCVVAAAKDGKPLVILLHPQSPDSEAIVVPRESGMHLASFPRDFEANATFRGRVTISGLYEAEGVGEDASATIWPDKPSLKLLPYWRQHGGPHEINISNAWTFAQAVASPDQLRVLKAKSGKSIRGRVTIVADDYSTSIECDVASFSARFISVVKPAIRTTAIPESAEGC